MLNRNHIALLLTLSLVGLAACVGPAASVQPLAGLSAPGASPATAGAHDPLPLYFVENRGQTDARVAFYVPCKDNTIYFTPGGLTLAFTPAPHPTSATAAMGTQTGDQAPSAGDPMAPAQRWAVKLDFVGANPAVQPVGDNPTGAVFSYFKGQASQWRSGVASFAQVRYPDLWPGIDLVYSGQANQLKYQFVVQPGADPAQIQLAYRGASSVRLTADGQLEVTTPLNTFRDAAPLAYQVKAGQRVPVEMGYVLAPPVTTGAAATYAYSFHLGAYDRSLPLILDPVVLVYAGYIGGSGLDFGRGIAVDSAGNAYVTGYTESDTTFPVTVGPDLTYNGGGDAFVAKVNSAGTALVYASYFGGAGSDQGLGIAVDSAGQAYITGNTNSGQASFPVTVGPDVTYNGGTDAFVAKVNASGTALIYAGYIGGAAYDSGNGIAVDSQGNAYVTGNTLSSQTTFPKTVGPDLTYGGGANFGDAFVAKVNAAGTALTYAGYIGGAGDESGNGIAVDKNGNAFVAGYSDTGDASFPATVGPDLTNHGNGDAFVAEVNAAGTLLDFAGFIGGSGGESAKGIAVDGVGNAYVIGETDSTAATFPHLNGPDLTYNGGAKDAFVAKVTAGGASLSYAGYIGGAGADFGIGIAVDSAGEAYVVGTTDSTQTSFPVVGGPDSTYNGGLNDAFVAKVNAAGTGLIFSGYLGGADNDQGTSVALDSAGDAFITRQTFSNQATFPVTSGPGHTYSDNGDIFVAKIISFVPSHFLYLPLVER